MVGRPTRSRVGKHLLLRVCSSPGIGKVTEYRPAYRRCRLTRGARRLVTLFRKAAAFHVLVLMMGQNELLPGSSRGARSRSPSVAELKRAKVALARNLRSYSIACGLTKPNSASRLRRYQPPSRPRKGEHN